MEKFKYLLFGYVDEGFCFVLYLLWRFVKYALLFPPTSRSEKDDKLRKCHPKHQCESGEAWIINIFDIKGL